MSNEIIQSLTPHSLRIGSLTTRSIAPALDVDLADQALG
jgi:hypothetical protein